MITDGLLADERPFGMASHNGRVVIAIGIVAPYGEEGPDGMLLVDATNPDALVHLSTTKYEETQATPAGINVEPGARCKAPPGAVPSLPRMKRLSSLCLSSFTQRRNFAILNSM